MEADIWHQRTRGAATGEGVWGAAASLLTSCSKLTTAAAIAQLGERQTEDLKVPGSIPGLGIIFSIFQGSAQSVSGLIVAKDAKEKSEGSRGWHFIQK